LHSRIKEFIERNKLFLLAFPLSFFLVLLVALGFISSKLDSPLDRSIVVDVPKGSTVLDLFNKLDEESEINHNRTILKLYSKLTEGRGPIKAGKYSLVEGMTTRQIIKLLRAGAVVSYRATFPEGWTFSQWRRKLMVLPHLNKKIIGKSDTEIAALIGIKGEIEGWFFPDTYYYNLGTSDLDLLESAYQKMKEIISLEWSSRNAERLIKSPYEAIILASMVEKETGYGPDRAKISSVFLNRLRSQMRLESDPTVIYGLGDSFDGDLKKHHLRSDTPFNTYTRFGLPPTPIASPGRESINVVLSENQSPFYYFVAMGNGKSYFSKNYKEHLAAVKRYQLGNSRRTP